ncbi:hypothetical protein V1508DRAFT_395065 [Lipomyces doorenjongii]|uniref:uncharacterized protein n=1 Tax=Lipomyces doorenjongii TaxID=383834 RepID=UPI0034CE1328
MAKYTSHFRVPDRLTLSSRFQDPASPPSQKDALHEVSLMADVSWMIDPPTRDAKSWRENWERSTIILAPYTKIHVTVEFERDTMAQDPVDFVETFAMSISRSKLWTSLRLEPILMIPNNPHYSPSSTLTAEFNLRFAPASLSVNAVFSSHSTVLLIVPLRSISLSFTFHSQRVPGSATTPKQRVDAKCGSVITEMLGLADKSLRNIILSKLAPKMPLLFCPGYAEAIQDRFKLLDTIIVPSLLNILRRRQSRLPSQEKNNLDRETILRNLWTVMTTSLKRKYLGSMVLEQFLDITPTSNISILTNTMLSEANSVNNSEYGPKLSSDAMLSVTSEPRLMDPFSEDMSFWPFDGNDDIDRHDEVFQDIEFDQCESMLYDSGGDEEVCNEDPQLFVCK